MALLYSIYRSIQHYFLLQEKKERAKFGDCPKIRRLRNIMNSPLPPDALPVARKFGEMVYRCEEAQRKSLEELDKL